jgi:hypothetical protein
MCNGNEQIVENQKKTASNFMQRREFPLFIRQKRHKVQPCLGKNEQIPEKKKKKESTPKTVEHQGHLLVKRLHIKLAQKQKTERENQLLRY